ncbi:MAG TPA: transglycosylase SLT domain-containing protein [Candidatus Kapabacteria bacterium]|nr:transglycosylase SLT domain-containing protein [Candidatus Kapabacteria bacterium]
MLLHILLLSTLPAFVDSIVNQELHHDSIEAQQPLLIPYRAEIERIADSFALPPSLVAAVIQEESRFAPWAARTEPHYKRKAIVQRSAREWSKRWHGSPSYETELDDRARSLGLMQVMGQLAREQGFAPRYLSEMHLPQHSLVHGAKHLRMLLDRYRGDTLSAISAYNQGNNRKRGETFANARYVYRVCASWKVYRRWLR